MESEKVKEIKEALECCTNNKGCEPCQRLSKKPYHLDDCRFVLLTDTLYLINELGSENERLTEERDLYKKQFNELEPRFFDLREENQQLKDRIAELEEQRDEQAFITEELIQEKHLWSEQARKETAREILLYIGNMLDDDSRFKLKDYQWHKDLCRQYGVDLGETK